MSTPVSLADGGTGVDLSSAGPGFLQQASNGANVTVLKHNLTAVASPTANDDSSAGYAIGSLWADATGDTLWQAVDVSVAAAIWAQIDNQALEFIQFDTSYSDGVAEGKLAWNSDDGALEVGLPGGNVALLGLEE